MARINRSGIGKKTPYRLFHSLQEIVLPRIFSISFSIIFGWGMEYSGLEGRESREVLYTKNWRRVPE